MQLSIAKNYNHSDVTQPCQMFVAITSTSTIVEIGSKGNTNMAEEKKKYCPKTPSKYHTPLSDAIEIVGQITEAEGFN